MMKAHTPLISPKHLASLRWRVLLCVARWLPWMITRETLNEAARVVALMVFLNVASRFAPPPPTNHRHGLKKAHGGRRAMIGSRLRRAMQGHDNASRIDAILSVLRNPKRWIALLARRLRKGLTRRRLIRAFRDDPCAQALANALTPAALNSS